MYFNMKHSPHFAFCILHLLFCIPASLFRRGPCLALLLVLAPAPLFARTLVLTDADCDAMAAICADSPRMSWAGSLYAETEYSNHTIDFTPRHAFLIRFPIEQIPKGQRITKAEWIVPYTLVSPAGGVRLQVRRLLVSWGVGVSHIHRQTRPEKLAWHTPGARGLGQDRAAKATTMVTFRGMGEQTLNVTEDVELWYSGVAPNHGWILTAEDQDAFIRAPSPFWGAPKGWKLRITYEPE